MVFFFFFFFFCCCCCLFFFFCFFFLSFSNHPLLFFILELFKEAWECGYNNNDIEENDRDHQRVFDTDSSALLVGGSPPTR